MPRCPKKDKVSFIETIPRELMTDILSRVAASSAADISSVKLSCKGLREIAEDAHVYRHACLDKFPIALWTPLCDNQQSFLNKCKQSGNPEICYREALVDFFNKTDFESACRNLYKAVKSGHVGALYVSCIVFLFVGNDQLKLKGIELLGKMNRKRNLRLCRRKLMKDLRQMWVMNPLLRDPPMLCSTHRRNYERTNKWPGEEEDQDQHHCQACAADKEVQLISSSSRYR